MKKLLLIGTALLSIAAYTNNTNSAFGSGLTASDEELSSKQNALCNQWKNEIVPTLLNKNKSLDDFNNLFQQFEKDYYEERGIPGKSPLCLDNDILYSGIRDILEQTCNDLKNLDEGVDKASAQIDTLINNDIGIQENLNVINKLSSAPYRYFYFDRIKEEKLKETFKSLFKLTSCISELKTEKLRNLLNQNITVHRFLQNTSARLMELPVLLKSSAFTCGGYNHDFHLEQIITSSLYSKQDGFNSLALAILLPILGDNITRYIPKNTKPEILSDLVKGLINYSTDVVKNPKILIKPERYSDKESIPESITEPLKSYNDLTKISSRSFNNKESLIDMINRKRKDPNLSEEFKKALKEIRQDILRYFQFSQNDNKL